MNGRRKEYIFTWFIENYSYCWHKNGEVLASPEFTADDLEGTTWKIELFPRGHSNMYKGYISIFLSRSKDDGPENFQMNYDLSILKNSELDLNSINDNQITFKMGNGHGYSRFVQVDEVLVRRKADYLPQDCLSVHCRIWKSEGNTQTLAESSARTCIGIEQISFLHEVEGFSALEPNKTVSVEKKYTSKKEITISSSLYFTDGPCCDGKIIVKITTNDANRILSKLKISLLHESGKTIECGEIDNRFDATGKHIKNIPLWLTRQYILNRKSEYMPDDKLSVLCECIFSTGVEYEKIESAFIGKQCSAGNQLTFADKDNIYKKKLSACPSALDELKRIYNHLPFTDVQLKTETKSFPVHKLLLCARSSVFNAMLTNDMKEKNTDLIQVNDINDDILQQFLQFLYSDNVDQLQWESAIKLYYVADKYEVEKLKMLCACFLIDNLNTSNAGELLLLADTHNDCDLKKVVEDYILKHEKDVFGSDEWGNLMETNPLLVSKTMRQKYMRKI